MYSTTGRIRYNIAMHMLINLLGGVCLWYYPEAQMREICSHFWIWMPEHFAYVSMVIAVIILASHYRQIHWFSGWVRRKKTWC